MEIVIHIAPQFEHHRYWLGAFEQGLRRHGLNPRVVHDFYPIPCDLAVFWSHGQRVRSIIEAQKAAGKDYLVLERGYLGDKTKWTSAGFNGHAGRADFLNDGKDSSRVESLGFKLQEWNPQGDYVLVMGQVPSDASLLENWKPAVNITSWLAETAIRVERGIGLPAVVRNHPIVKEPERSLEDDLSGAKCVVTWNSTSGVDAVVAGKPVIALDEGSMVYSIAGHEIDDVIEPPMPDRGQWLNEIAWAQWNVREMKSGKAWDHLGQRYAGR